MLKIQKYLLFLFIALFITKANANDIDSSFYKSADLFAKYIINNSKKQPNKQNFVFDYLENIDRDGAGNPIFKEYVNGGTTGGTNVGGISIQSNSTPIELASPAVMSAKTAQLISFNASYKPGTTVVFVFKGR